jgi:hypothetical protein
MRVTLRQWDRAAMPFVRAIRMSTPAKIARWPYHAKPGLGYPQGAAVFVWGTWGLMLVAALACVWQYGSNVPSWDEWDMVPTLTGAQPVSITWLWSQHNEHRIPLPRLIFLLLNHLVGPDFRVVMFFNVIAVSALALAMIVTAQRQRGELSYSDAFFPLLLLHWGHSINLLWGWQLQFFASTILAGIVLLLIVHVKTGIGTASAVVVGACLLLLPLCGGNGLALVPPLALWLGSSAIRGRGVAEIRTTWSTHLILGLALAALLLMVAYFVGYEPVPYHPTSAGVRAIPRTAIQFLTNGLGPATKALWPLSGLVGVCLLVLSVAILGMTWWKRPRERCRVVALLAFLGAMGCLALAIGLGRDGFESRYVLLAAPAWCCVYFITSLYSSKKINMAARMTLLLITGLMLWPNTRIGIEYADDLRNRLGSFERDMVDGLPIHELSCRYRPDLHPHHDIVTDYLPMLRRAGVGQYQSLQDDLPFLQISLFSEQAASTWVAGDGGIARGTEISPYLLATLPEAKYLYGVRLKYSSSGSNGISPYVSVRWKGSDHDSFNDKQFWKYSPTGDRANWERGTWTRLLDLETTTTVWVCEAIKDIRVDVYFRPGAGEFRMLDALLLAPVGDTHQ